MHLFFLSIHLLMDAFGWFCILAFGNTAVRNMVEHASLCYRRLAALGIYPILWSLNHMASLLPDLKSILDLLIVGICRCSPFSTSLSAFVNFSLLNHSHLTRVAWHFIVFLTCVFLMASDVELFSSMFLLAICTS